MSVGQNDLLLFCMLPFIAVLHSCLTVTEKPNDMLFNSMFSLGHVVTKCIVLCLLNCITSITSFVNIVKSVTLVLQK